MTSLPFPLESGEQLLAEARATYYVTRMLAQTGTLYLTDRRLLFTPTGTLEKAIGAAYPVELRLPDVQKVLVEGGTTKRLVVRSAVQTYRFVARNVDELERRLGERLARTGGGRPTGGEEVVASAKVHLFVSRLLTQSGMLYLTTRRLSFVPVGVLDRAVGARDVGLPLTEIEAIATEGSLDRRTTIRGRAHRMVLLGHLPDTFLESVRRTLAELGIVLRPQVETGDAPAAAEAPAAGRTCGACGAGVGPSFRFCSQCGEALASS